MFLVAALIAPTTMSGAASAAYPVFCSVSGSLTFSPSLSSTRTLATPGSTEFTVVSGTLSNCLYAGGTPAPTQGSFSISLNTTEKVRGHPTEYYTGDCGAFATIVSAIRNSEITVTWTGDAEDGGTTTMIPKKIIPPASNQSGEKQFSLLGNRTSVTGEYAEGTFAQITLSLNPASTTALSNNCANGPVNAAMLDASSSVAAL